MSFSQECISVNLCQRRYERHKIIYSAQVLIIKNDGKITHNNIPLHYLSIPCLDEVLSGFSPGKPLSLSFLVWMLIAFDVHTLSSTECEISIQ